MNAENQPNPTRFPFLRRCLRLVFNRWTLYAMLALITAVALFVAVENFRGKQAWERYRKSAAARGIELDFAKFTPAPVPAAENGASAPIVQSWFLRAPPGDAKRQAEVNRTVTNLWPLLFGEAQRRYKAAGEETNPNAKQDDRKATDFAAWQSAFSNVHQKALPPKRQSKQPPTDEAGRQQSAIAVLKELEVYSAALEQLRTATRKPHFQYPVIYKQDDPFSILLPHLARVKSAVALISLRASAALEAGRTDQAFEDVMLGLRLGDTLEDDNFLISQLVRIAGLQIMTQPLWEGLAGHRWSESQLREIQERFLKADFATAMTRSMAVERAGGATVLLNIIHRKNLAESLNAIDPSDGNPPAEQNVTKVLSRVAPRGWTYLELVNLISTLDGLIEQGWEKDTRTFNLERLDFNEVNFKGQLRGGVSAVWHHQVFARLLLPALTKAASRSARAQSTANQAAMSLS